MVDRFLELTAAERERYRGYTEHPKFVAGYQDYLDCRHREFDGVDGQAYDRGAECAMLRGSYYVRCTEIKRK